MLSVILFTSFADPLAIDCISIGCCIVSRYGVIVEEDRSQEHFHGSNSVPFTASERKTFPTASIRVSSGLPSEPSVG